MSEISCNPPRPISSIDAKSIKIGSQSPTIQNSNPLIGTSPEAHEQSSVVHNPANPHAKKLLDAMWRSPDRHHQIGILNRQSSRFNNQPVDGVADAIARALKLSCEGAEVYFACAEYLTPYSRTAANASGACGFWLDIDCGEDKAANGKGYPTVNDAEDALDKFCEDAGLPKPTHIVYSGGGLHAYWALDGVILRDEWQELSRKFKALTKVCGFLADDSRTADIASVLRIPGTLNHKFSPPRPVTLEAASAELVERPVMLDAIAGAYSKLCIAVTSKPPGRPSAATTTTTAIADGSLYGPPELERLASALVTLDPDCDEETWKLRRIAPLALEARKHPDLSTVLYELTRAWSSGALCGRASTAWITPGGNGLTGEEHFDATWERFLKNDYIGIPVTLGTIFHDAMQLGWVDPTKAECLDPEEQFEVIDVTVEGNA